MAQLISVRGFTPQIHKSTWMADDAVITGNVTVGEQCSIWFKTVIRGDVCPIRIGNLVNIQDGTVIHGTLDKSETIIGDRVSIGHNATIHGCRLLGNALVGMGAIVMDNTVVEENVIIAAGAVVLENQTLKSGYIYGGIPAKIIKELDVDQAEFYINRTAENYVMYSSWYKG